MRVRDGLGKGVCGLPTVMMRSRGSHRLIASGLDVGRPVTARRRISVCVSVVVGRAAAGSLGERHGPMTGKGSATVPRILTVTQNNGAAGRFEARENTSDRS